MVTERRRDTASERIVLGSVLLDGSLLDGDLADLLPVDFFDARHEALYRTLTGAHRAGEPTDAAALVSRLAKDPIPGLSMADVAGMAQEVSSTATAGFYAARVRDYARIRRVQEAAERIALTAATGDLDDVESLVQSTRGVLDEAAATRGSGNVRWYDDILAESFTRWETPDDEALPTGWVEVDDTLNGGLRPGHLMVIGARPAVGKTAAATVLVRHIAQTGAAALFASLEMSENELADRVTSAAAGVLSNHLTKRKLDDSDWRRLERFVNNRGEWPIAIDDRPHQSVAQIAARARDVSRSKHGLSVIVVDYLQLVTPRDAKASRQEQVGGVARDLKLLAKDLRVPVVALAQVNRASQQRGDGRPVMSDLRESGDIETSADEIVLLHRDDDQPADIELNVVKNRHGGTGRVVLEWAPYVSDIRNPMGATA